MDHGSLPFLLDKIPRSPDDEGEGTPNPCPCLLPGKVIPVLRLAPFVALVLGGLLVPTAGAQEFTIDLKVQSSKENKTANAETAVVNFKLKPRGTFKVKAGEKIRVQWTMKNVDAKEVFKNVLVHFFVVKLDKAGQAFLPKLDKNVAVESALLMDFRPKDQTQGDLTFVIAQPGAYLLRLETIGARIDFGGHEHYANLDLIVE
jgi:hypothetical protein